jgi:L-glyceraldehyde 3-phosphate reductase
MRYRQFGTTGINVSQLTFGGGAVGGLLINADKETRLAALRRAFDGGINWIDTAAQYGNGRSEESIGELLPELGATPHISTKFNIDTTDLSDIRGQIERSLQESLGRLRMDSVTLFQLHNQIGERSEGRMLAADKVLKDGGVLDALEALRGQGLFRHFGITALGETPAILRVIERGRIDSAQVYFNLLNPSAAGPVPSAWPVYEFNGVLAACEAHGVAVMNIRVFSAGVVASGIDAPRGRPLTPGDTIESDAAKATAVFAALGDTYGTRAQTALRFALAEPRLSTVVIGLAEIAHLDEAIAAEEMGPLPEEGF